jgi:hypothetical protein
MAAETVIYFSVQTINSRILFSQFRKSTFLVSLFLIFEKFNLTTNSIYIFLNFVEGFNVCLGKYMDYRSNMLDFNKQRINPQNFNTLSQYITTHGLTLRIRPIFYLHLVIKPNDPYNLMKCSHIVPSSRITNISQINSESACSSISYNNPTSSPDNLTIDSPISKTKLAVDYDSASKSIRYIELKNTAHNFAEKEPKSNSIKALTTTSNLSRVESSKKVQDSPSTSLTYKVLTRKPKKRTQSSSSSSNDSISSSSTTASWKETRKLNKQLNNRINSLKITSESKNNHLFSSENDTDQSIKKKRKELKQNDKRKGLLPTPAPASSTKSNGIYFINHYISKFHVLGPSIFKNIDL